VSPEEIFNMFFGGAGGMQGGGGPGFHFYSNGFGPGAGMQFRRGGQQRQRAAQQGQQGQQNLPRYTPLLQLIPLILFIVLSFFNFDSTISNSYQAMPGENRYFSLVHQRPFTNPLQTRLTNVKDIPYFVSDKFLRTYYRDKYQLSQVERMVENAYENYLDHECKKQKVYKKQLEKEANKPKLTHVERTRRLRQAQEYELSRCQEHEDLFPRSKNQYRSRF